MFINRDWNRTESDDFKLNIERHLVGTDNEAVPVYTKGDILCGWKIKKKFE